MNRVKRTAGIAALMIAGLAFSSLIPSAAFAENTDDPRSVDSTLEAENDAAKGELIDVEPIDGGFSYQLPTDSAGPISLFAGCQGQYLLRKVNNRIEWGASNNCTNTPAKKYLPWYMIGMLQRAKVGSSSYETVHGPAQSGDRWGTYGNIATNFSCLGSTKYKYRVKWEVRYTGLWTGWWYSDTREIACA